MSIWSRSAILLFTACAPVAPSGQTLPSAAPRAEQSAAEIVQALVSVRGDFEGDGIHYAFVPASAADSATLAAATRIADDQMLPLIDCLADTSSSFVTSGGRAVSRGVVCYFAAIQTGWFHRHRANMPVLGSTISIRYPDVEGQRRASAVWRDSYVAHGRRGGPP